MQSAAHEAPDTITVPRGFQVRCWRMLPARGVIDAPGGLTVGSFGYIGDDFAAIDGVFAAMRTQTARPHATLIDERITLSESFSRWESLQTREVRAGIVWTAHADGLSWALARPDVREQLLAGFRSFAGRRQWLVLSALPPAELRSALVLAGVELRFATPQQHCFLEIAGPDGRTLSAVLSGAPSIVQDCDLAALGGRPMLAASRLVAQLEALGARSELEPLFRTLLQHPAALVVRCDPQGQVQSMQFPECSEPLLPVYPDAATWSRADRELRSDGQTMGMAPFEPRQLLQPGHRDRRGLVRGQRGADQVPGADQERAADAV